MYKNRFKRQWCSNELIKILREVPDVISVNIAANEQYIPASEATFHEINISHIFITLLDGMGSVNKFDVNGYVNKELSKAIELLIALQIKQVKEIYKIDALDQTAPKRAELIKMQEFTKNQVESELGLKNNLVPHSRFLVYYLNNYTLPEKRRLLNMLSIMDTDGIDVSITFDFGRSPKEKLENTLNQLELLRASVINIT